MRKIQNDVLKKMIEAGQSQRECAQHFGVSDAAISKKVKRWEADAERLPESVAKLTPKQQHFVMEIASGKSQTAAAASSFDSVSLASARVMGCKLMKEPDIAVAVSDLMAQSGIPRRRRVERLADIINSHDLAVASRGLDLSFKLSGEYAPEKLEVTVFPADEISAAVKELRLMMAQAKEDEEKTIDIIPDEKEVI